MEANAEVSEPDEMDRVWDHVVKQMESLGFNPVQAISLADAGVDWHEAQRLLNKGCPHERAMHILI